LLGRQHCFFARSILERLFGAGVVIPNIGILFLIRKLLLHRINVESMAVVVHRTIFLRLVVNLFGQTKDQAKNPIKPISKKPPARRFGFLLKNLAAIWFVSEGEYDQA
jgi:hypothetical protein